MEPRLLYIQLRLAHFSDHKSEGKQCWSITNTDFRNLNLLS